MPSMVDDHVVDRGFEESFTSQNTNPTTGPILNPHANLMPERDDSFRDLSSTLDYRLHNGIGVSRYMHKPDSMGGQTAHGMHGLAKPTKLFGRDAKSIDLTYQREEMMDRIRAAQPKLGSKPHEVPGGPRLHSLNNGDSSSRIQLAQDGGANNPAMLYPWEWNNTTALGFSAPNNPNQYNRNYPLPDAVPAAARLYKPAPSRVIKMLGIDYEEQALRPNQTRISPTKAVDEDLQRQQYVRTPTNVDIPESVQYENIMPRGMRGKVEAMPVYSDVEPMRRPIGSNETGERGVSLGRWETPRHEVNPLQAMHNEERLNIVRRDFRDVRGRDTENEIRDFERGKAALEAQDAPDPFDVGAVQASDRPTYFH